MLGTSRKPIGGGAGRKAAALVATATLVLTGITAATALGDNGNTDETDSTVRATGNSWQIVQCGPEDKDSDGCTTANKYVRVHKWVTATDTENLFDVHLSIDKADDEISEVLNAYASFENNNSVGTTVGNTGDGEKCNGQCPIKPGNTAFYYQIQFTDESGKVHVSDVVQVNLEMYPKGAFLTPEAFEYGDPVFVAWARDDDKGNKDAGHTPDNPAVLKVNYNDAGYDTIFGTRTTTVASVSVTDQMGDHITFDRILEVNDHPYTPSENDPACSNGVLQWSPEEKADLVPDSKGWFNDIANITYRVTLTVPQDGSSGMVGDGQGSYNPTPIDQLGDNQKFLTNGEAHLDYKVTTTINGQENSPESGEIPFKSPVVRGLLYDVVATKTDENDELLSGATFQLSDNNGIIETRTYTTGNDGRIVFTGLPHGSYTLSEETAPVGFDKTDDTWTFTLCYTGDHLNRDTLIPSTANSRNAMADQSLTLTIENTSSISPVTVPGLTETKTIQGGDAAPSEFSFTVNPENPESAEIAGFTDNTRIEENCSASDNGLTYTCGNPAMTIDPDKGSAEATVHEALPLVFDSKDDIGKTYTYTYRESDQLPAGWHRIGASTWTVTVTVGTKDDDGRTLQAVVSVYEGDTDDGDPERTYTYTAGEDNAEKPMIGFMNVYGTVAVIPKTGGDATALWVALAGGGILFAAGAAWLLARRRRV